MGWENATADLGQKPKVCMQISWRHQKCRTPSPRLGAGNPTAVGSGKFRHLKFRSVVYAADLGLNVQHLENLADILKMNNAPLRSREI